jgi:pimeloyl-ACP methyl ester carboxylesterase
VCPREAGEAPASARSIDGLRYNRRVPSGPLACETAKSRRFHVNGLELHALEWPASGPGLLFLHGGAAHAHWFDHVIPPFLGRFHVVSLDQRGHGESVWPSPPSYRTEDFAGDIAAVTDALGWSRFALIGHSMGGHNALAFAAWHPDRVRHLVIMDSRPSLPADRVAAMRERGRRPRRGHPTAAAAVAAFRLLPRETTANPALLAHLARVGIAERNGRWTYRFDPASHGSREPVDSWALLPRIAALALILRGERSPILPRQMAERMREAIPQAVLVEIAGAYHHVTLDAPEDCAAALGRFLRADGGEQAP